MATANMQEMLDQAFEAGRAAERKMIQIAMLGGGHVITLVSSVPSPGPIGTNIPSTKPASKAVSAPKAAKATVVARGVKKAAMPHSKGVKEGIVKHLGEAGLATVPVIIAKLGFKESSVRATLMALKKKGIASSEAGVWSLTPDARQSGGYGNSEASTQQPPF